MAGGTIASLKILLGLDSTGVEQGVGRAKTAMGGFSLSATAIGAAAGAAIGGMGVAAMKMGDQYKTATDTIRTATGATGQTLAGLTDSFRNVAGTVKEDIGTTATVMSDLNTRLGLTGPALEGLTKYMIEFARVTGTDAATDVQLVTRLFGDWSVATEDQQVTLDKLMRASQATGVSVDDLSLSVVQFGAPLRALGFDLDTSMALLGKWGKEGVNTETVLAGMRMAVANFAKQGIDPKEGLPALIDKVKGLDDAQGLLAVKQIVGQRAANDFFRAIKEGRFDVTDLTAAIADGTDTVASSAADTRDAGDAIAEFKNKILVAVGPITDGLAGIADQMGNTIYLVPAVGGAIGGLTAKLWAHVAATAAASGGWKAYAASLGPAAAALGIVTVGLIGADQASQMVAREADQATSSIQGLTNVTLDQAKAMLEAADKIDATRQRTQLFGLIDMDATRAQDALTAQLRLTAHLAQYELTSGLQAAGQQAEFLSHATADAGYAADDLTTAAGTATAHLSDLAWQAGLTADEITTMEGNISSALTSLGPDFVMTDAAMQALADRFGVDVGQIKDEWSGLKDTYATDSALIRDYIATLPPSFQMTQDAANDMATILGVSADEIALTFKQMGIEIVDTATQTGTEIPGAMGKGMIANASALTADAQKLKDMLQAALQPHTDAITAIGKEYMDLIKQGFKSGDPAVVAQAQQVALDSIAAIENGGLTGGKKRKGLKDVGIYYTELLASGMDKGSVAAALAAGGVADDVVFALTGVHVQNALVRGADNIAGAWLDAFVRTIKGGKSIINHAIDVATAATRGSSPPKEGPLMHIDQWGENIGKAWSGGLNKGLGDGLTALSQFTLPKIPTPSTPTLALAGPLPSGVVAGGAGASVVVNINGPIYGGPAGLDQLQRDLTARVRQSVRGASRPVSIT